MEKTVRIKMYAYEIARSAVEQGKARNICDAITRAVEHYYGGAAENAKAEAGTGAEQTPAEEDARTRAEKILSFSKEVTRYLKEHLEELMSKDTAAKRPAKAGLPLGVRQKSVGSSRLKTFSPSYPINVLGRVSLSDVRDKLKDEGVRGWSRFRSLFAGMGPRERIQMRYLLRYGPGVLSSEFGEPSDVFVDVAAASRR